jgi:hypothetical protein
MVRLSAAYGVARAVRPRLDQAAAAGPPTSVGDGQVCHALKHGVLLFWQSLTVWLLCGLACLLPNAGAEDTGEEEAGHEGRIARPPAMAPMRAGPLRLFKTMPLR